MFAVLAALSGMEREYIRDKTLDGQESTRRRGNAIGGAKVTDEAMLAMALHLRDKENMSLRDIAATMTPLTEDDDATARAFMANYLHDVAANTAEDGDPALLEAAAAERTVGGTRPPGGHHGALRLRLDPAERHPGRAECHLRARHPRGVGPGQAADRDGRSIVDRPRLPHGGHGRVTTASLT